MQASAVAAGRKMAAPMEAAQMVEEVGKGIVVLVLEAAIAVWS